MARLNRLFWFLRHPQYYPELYRRLQRNFWAILDASRNTHTAEARAKAKQDATAWCESLAVDTAVALHQLANFETFVPFQEKFKDTVKDAQIRVEKCPVTMGGGGNLDLVYYLAEYSQATRIIETGIASGWSSLALLLSLKYREGSLLVSTDLPYVAEDSDKYVGCAVPLELRSYWKVLPYADRESLPQALQLLTEIDLCHYDSDKSYEGRMWAYPQLWKALRPGGIFISDDINDDFGFRDFCQRIGEKPLIVRDLVGDSFRYVGVLVKPN